GRWRADWPDHEGYDVGPPSIAWLTWHIGFWWSMAIDHSFGDGSLSRENVLWPGTADGVREWLGRLQRQWQGVLEQVSDDDLRSAQRTRWPFQDRAFGDVIAWVNVELTKHAAFDLLTLAQPDLLSLIGPQAVRKIGLRYRALVPSENEVHALYTAILAARPWPSSIAGLVEQDFAIGRTMVLQGWVVSVTEA